MTDAETLRILDDWLLAHHDYEKMPPRPTGPFFGGEMARWEKRRLQIERRVWETGIAYRAMCAERGARVAGGADATALAKAGG